MARYLFLDVETTGLDTNVDQITEIAWIIPNERDLLFPYIERYFYVQHDRLPNEWVLGNTDYLTRILPAPEKVHIDDVLGSLRRSVSRDLPEIYLVAANPSFDDRMLRRHGLASPPYHYHLIDVEVMAMGILGLDDPPHLKDLPALLGLEENSAPHTALEDARTVKRCFEALRTHQRHNLDAVKDYFVEMQASTRTS